MPFSDRMGFSPKREAIQLNSIDAETRVLIYNYLNLCFDSYWNRWRQSIRIPSGETAGKAIWGTFWRNPIDGFPYYRSEFFDVLKPFVFSMEWYKVYDLIEFIVASTDMPLSQDTLNDILAIDLVGYRLVSGKIVPISDDAELSAINESLNSPDAFTSSRAHIECALSKLSERPHPDLRNAVKEAISSVESATRVVSEEPKATLADALKALERSGTIHPALKDAWVKLYGYTSDSNGIRHSLIEESELDYATTKYLVVSCAAFVNLHSLLKVDERI